MSEPKVSSGNAAPGGTFERRLQPLLRSFGFLPDIAVEIATEVSRWLLLTAIASVGLKTQPKDMLKVGMLAAALLVAETAFLTSFVAIPLGLRKFSTLL